MATETVNLKLIKPDINDFYNVKDFNDNADKIDQAIAGKADLEDIPTSLPANGGNADTVGNLHIVTLTQSEYDALAVKDNNTLYFTT